MKNNKLNHRTTGTGIGDVLNTKSIGVALAGAGIAAAAVLAYKKLKPMVEDMINENLDLPTSGTSSDVTSSVNSSTNKPFRSLESNSSRPITIEELQVKPKTLTPEDLDKELEEEYKRQEQEREGNSGVGTVVCENGVCSLN